MNSPAPMLVFGYPYEEWIRLTFDEREERVPDWRTREVPGRIGNRGLRVTMNDLAKPDEKEAIEARTAAERSLVGLRALAVTPDNMALVGDILDDVKSKLKKLEARLKEITDPIRAAEASARDLFRPAIDALKESEKILKKKIADSQTATLEANRRAMEATQKAVEIGDSRGAALASAQLAPVGLPAGVSSTPKLVYTITAPDLVPRELCSPDPAKIKAHIAIHGEKAIPGITITHDVTISMRTTK